MILFLFITAVWWFCGAKIWNSCVPGALTGEAQVAYMLKKPVWFAICYLPRCIFVGVVMAVLGIYGLLTVKK